MVHGKVGISEASRYYDYRHIVSELLMMYVFIFIKLNYGKDISNIGITYSHNKIHTNVIAYVESLEDWYPIMHNSKEKDNATENKVRLVNNGNISITDVIPTKEISPS